MLRAIFFFLVLLAAPLTQALADDKPLPLSHGWEARWGESPTDEEGKTAWAQESGPSDEWKPVTNLTNPPGGSSVDTLWERVQLPTGTWSNPALYFASFDQYAEIYLDGKRIHTFGALAKSGKPVFFGYPPQFVPLPEGFEGKMLVLRIRSDHVNIGVVCPPGTPAIGNINDFQKQMLRADVEKLVLAIIFVAAGLFAFFLFLRQRHEKTYLSFAGTVFFIGIYTFLRTDSKLFFLDDHFQANSSGLFKLELLTIYATPPLFCLLLEQLFAPGRKSATYWAVRLQTPLNAVLSLLVITDLVAGPKTLLPFWLGYLVFGILGCSTPIHSAARGNKEGWIFAVGASFFFIFGLVDVFMSMGLIPRLSSALTQYGVAVFVGSLATILGKRFVEVHKKVARLKHKLEQILSGTTEMASVHEQFAAASQAVRYVLGEVQLGPNPGASLFITAKAIIDKQPVQELIKFPIVVDGQTVSESRPEVLPSSSLREEPALTAMSKEKAYLGPRQEIVVPLAWGGAHQGFLTIETYASPTLEEEDSYFVDTLSNSLSLALENIAFLRDTAEKARLEGEVNAAKVVQETLLPNPLDIPNIELVSHYVAATSVGGDWYGYTHDKRGKRVFFFVGDVTGHGIPSALLTGVVCGAIYGSELRIDLLDGAALQPNTEQRLKDIATAVNSVVYDTGRHAERLMTMAFLCLEYETGMLHYLNAGHNSPMVLSSNNKKAKILSASGNRLGFTSTDFDCDYTSMQMHPGDMFLCYTDGIVENSGPKPEDLLSEKRLRMIFERSADPLEAKKEILASLEKLWQNKPPDDDYSMLIAKWLGPSGADAVPAGKVAEATPVQATSSSC